MGKKVTLRQSRVLFDREKHEYWLPNKEDGSMIELSGITSMIERQWGSGYENVPKKILQASADYGSKIHEIIELYTILGINDNSVELQDFISLCESEKLIIETAEYLVSDESHFASSIDLVARVSDDEFDLIDIKSFSVKGSKIDAEKLFRLRMQLSCYKKMFLMQNPEAKVRKLAVMIIRNKPKKSGEFDHQVMYQEVEPIPEDIVDELMKADIEGRPFENPYLIPKDLISTAQSIKSLTLILRNTQEKLAELKEKVLSRMEQMKCNCWKLDDLTLTRKLPTVRSSFSLADFKEANPDFNTEPYMKESNVSASLLVNL